MLGEYEQTIRDLSERIVAAQKPIRILDSLKWDISIENEFFAKQCKQLPKIDKNYYLEKNPLQFDTKEKVKEFRDIERDIRRSLGQYSGVASIMQRMCQEYIRVVDLLKARGTKKFTDISQELYGSSKDAFHVGAPNLKDMADVVSQSLNNLKGKLQSPLDEKNLTSEEAVKKLREKFANYFDEEDRIRVELSDGIVADAAAGADRIKINKDVKFSERDIRMLERHEGWVHLGTTLNGMAQPICTFLSKGVPSSTVTQEGLAIITELFTFSSYPYRVSKLMNRIMAVNMVEDGANFIDVYQFNRESGLSEYDSYQSTLRVFRGSTPQGGPYTKDLSYSKGFILIYNYMRLAAQQGVVDRIPLLFVGKTSLEDVHILADLMHEGIVVPPKYLPPQFRDLAAVSAWMVYSLFLNKLDLSRMAMDFHGML